MEDNWDNMHVVKAMIVFGFGNFIGTTLNSIEFFDDFPSKYFPIVNIICFIAMYIVNFFFTMRNYEHSMIVLERNVHKNLSWYEIAFISSDILWTLKTPLPRRYQKLILYSRVFNYCSKLFAQIFITVFENCQIWIKSTWNTHINRLNV